MTGSFETKQQEINQYWSIYQSLIHGDDPPNGNTRHPHPDQTSQTLSRTRENYLPFEDLASRYARYRNNRKRKLEKMFSTMTADEIEEYKEEKRIRDREKLMRLKDAKKNPKTYYEHFKKVGRLDKLPKHILAKYHREDTS
jgi:N-glycosylase/DNA lyase